MKRRNALALALAQLCGGIRRGGRRGLLRPNSAGEAVRRWSPLDDYADEILALVEEQDDRTLDEIVAAMRKHRIPGSRTALFRFLERRGITHKKECCTHPSRSERTWPAPAGAGYASEGCLIRPILSSSMRRR